MGGSGTITLVGSNVSTLSTLWEYAHELERMWTRFSQDSELSQLNLSEGVPVEVSPETITLVEQMIEGYHFSDKFFTPTLLPDLLKAGYSSSVLEPESTTRIPRTAVSGGDMDSILIEAQTITLPATMTLDPGGIGKGLAADMLCQRARDLGAWGAMVELGGDVVVTGDSPTGSSWSIGVENPFNPQEHMAVIKLTSGAVATSSQRKRRFGTRHHVINPQTHDSAETTVQTVTVVSDSGSHAEVLTKRGFMDDPHTYLSWLPSVGAAGIVVFENKTFMASPNWSAFNE